MLFAIVKGHIVWVPVHLPRFSAGGASTTAGQRQRQHTESEQLQQL
jgi:hypothetical protein